MKGFVIDTNMYSGNFERELCAYITGVVGDCEVGTNKIEFNEIDGVMQVADDHGCERPVAAYETPNCFNNGMGFNYTAGQEDIALEKWKESWIKNEEQSIATAEGHRGKDIDGWTDEVIDNAVDRHELKIKEVKATTKVSAYPAYQSVIIYFEDEYLTKEIIELMKARAYEYDGEFTIDGFRIVTTTIMTETEEI